MSWTLYKNLITLAGRIGNTTRVTTTYDILSTDYTIFCNTDSSPYIVTLPAGVNGQEFKIINCGSNVLTIAPTGAELLRGANSSDTLIAGGVTTLTYETTEGWW